MDVIFSTASYAYVILLALIVILLVKLMMSLAEVRRLRFLEDRQGLVLTASLGGYYYWDKLNDYEEFSLSLIDIFKLSSEVKTFADFLKKFGKDRTLLQEAFERIRRSDQMQFSFNIRSKVSGKRCYFQCAGYRVNDHAGQMVGVVIWFFDITEYADRLERMDSENTHIKQQLIQFTNILNMLPFPVWQRDSESFDIKYYNVMYSRFVDNGLPHDQVSQIPQLSDGLTDYSKEAFDNGRVFESKKHLVYDGERRFYSVSETPYDDKKFILGVASDITRQEEIENELDRHISAHADLLESSSSAMAVYGRDMKLKFYNQAFIRLGEFDEAWLSGNPTYAEILEWLRERRLLPEQADFSSFREAQLKLFDSLLETNEEFFFLPDGRTLRVIVIPHALGGLSFAYEDLTDRLDMERSYNTLIEVQRVTLDNISEGLIVWGTDNILKLYNPRYAELWPDEVPLLGKKPHVSELIEASKGLYKYHGSWKKSKEQLLHDLSIREFSSVQLERKDGMVINRMTIPLPEGETLVSYVDVTDTKLLERSLRERNQALEEADKLKTDFLTNISYELRTPLTSIMGFAELLKDGLSDDVNDAQKEYMNHINESSLELMVLIDGVLDLTSFEAGCLTLEMSRFPIKDVFEFGFDTLSDRAERKGLTFTNLTESDGMVELFGDVRRVSQTLYNIIDNAIKYTPEGGQVSVGIDRINDKNGEEKIQIWVQDTGMGIVKKEQSKVFDRFYQTPSAQATGGAGVGLGLAFVKNVVELHGGRVILESNKNSGTRVTCEFPLPTDTDI